MFYKVRLKPNASVLPYFHLRGSLTILGKYLLTFPDFFHAENGNLAKVTLKLHGKRGVGRQ